MSILLLFPRQQIPTCRQACCPFPDRAGEGLGHPFECGDDGAVVGEPPEALEWRGIAVQVMRAHTLHEPQLAMRAADAAAAVAAPGGLADRVGVDTFVDCDGAGVQVARDAFGATAVARPDRGGEAVGAVVRQGRDLGLRGEGHNREQRAEGFLAHTEKFVGHMTQHGRLEKISGEGG